MARLPTPGGDNGNWGDILNEYLSQALKTDGTIKDNVVTSDTIAPNAITTAKIATDAVGATQIADGSITNALLADGTIAETKLANSVQTKLNQTAPTWATLSGKPAVVAAGTDQTAARLVIKAASSKTFFIDDYGADPTGASASDTAVTAALADLGTSRGIIEFGVGTYRLDSSKVLAHAGQYFKGQGIGVTTIDCRGTGSGLQCWDSTVPTSGLSAPGRGGGVIGGLTIDGTNNSNANSIGLQIGDLINPVVENVRIVGFINTGCIGFLGQNRYSWTEYGKFQITSDYNTNCFVIESHASHPLIAGGKSSWSYNTLDFGFSAEANQNGVIFRNNVNATGVQWFMRFNCNPGATNTGVAVTIGENGTDNSGVEGLISWFGEATNPGAVGHTDINIGAVASLRGFGALEFHDFSADFVAGSAVPYRVTFAGRVNCASLGHYTDVEVPFVTIGDPGRFGALGDDANYINIQEGDSGSWPQLVARGPSDHIGINIVPKGLGSIQVNGIPVGYRAESPPASAAASGTAGQIAFDQNYIYICTGTNTWKRVAIASW